jgi:predicted MFS family arabinose efflux permease
LLLGIGNAAAQLSRYAVAELFAPAQRGVVLGAVVWGGTVGAILGPNLLGPTAAVAASAGWPSLTGAYVVALLAMAGSAAATLLMPSRSAKAGKPQSLMPGFRALLEPAVAVPMAAMVAANFTMVAVMTMTPVHVQLHGQGLHVIGIVISAHMVGMFALSPLSGRLADWRGGNTVVALGVLTLVSASASAAVLDASDTLGLSIAVFALGVGWNLCWVGGSSLLAQQQRSETEIQAQGDVDAVVWTTSTAASLLSGALLAAGGFALVALVAGVIAALPLVALTASSGRRRLRLQESES